MLPSDWILDTLAGGPSTRRDLLDAAEDVGIHRETVASALTMLRRRGLVASDDGAVRLAALVVELPADVMTTLCQRAQDVGETPAAYAESLIRRAILQPVELGARVRVTHSDWCGVVGTVVASPSGEERTMVVLDDLAADAVVTSDGMPDVTCHLFEVADLEVIGGAA